MIIDWLKEHNSTIASIFGAVEAGLILAKFWPDLRISQLTCFSITAFFLMKVTLWKISKGRKN